MAHMTQAKRVLTYLKTTKNTGITYGRKIHDIIGHNIIYGYADADFATDLDSRKSTTGWVFMYNGGAISWRSHQQSITALSTSEAEYMSLSDSAKEARSLLKLNITLETNNKNCIKIYEDNRGAEKWTRTLSEPTGWIFYSQQVFFKRVSRFATMSSFAVGGPCAVLWQRRKVCVSEAI